jgi:acetyl-CoA acetyltransferase
MMGFAIDRSRTIISAMILGRRVTAQDVAWLRREVFAGNEVTREAADELFAVARANMDNAPEWKEFFVEMIARHMRQDSPVGVVSEERAAWLLTRVDECKSVEALAALVNVLAEARSVPQWFLDAVRARASGGWPSVTDPLPAATAG